jgi:hypothetical protein
MLSMIVLSSVGNLRDVGIRRYELAGIVTVEEAADYGGSVFDCTQHSSDAPEPKAAFTPALR